MHRTAKTKLYICFTSRIYLSATTQSLLTKPLYKSSTVPRRCQTLRHVEGKRYNAEDGRLFAARGQHFRASVEYRSDEANNLHLGSIIDAQQNVR